MFLLCNLLVAILNRRLRLQSIYQRYLRYNHFIPTAFSPNGDLSNDVFKVYGKNIKEIKLEIFNRWGEQLLNVSDADPSWNGVYLNQPCQEGIYLYKIELKSYNGQILYLNGLFTLLR